MAVKEIKEITCDVCACHIPSVNHKCTELQVIFTTEQTEGRSTKPYLSNQTLDICDKCINTVLTGKMLFASGAMGYNNYYFNK